MALGDARLAWRKSSSSPSGGACVEVAATPGGGVVVRNSKRPDGPTIRYTDAEWRAFLIGAKAGEFDDLLESRPD